MWRKDEARQALAGRERSNRLLLAITVVAVLASAALYWHGSRQKRS